MSKVVRLNDESIQMLEDYRNFNIENSKNLGMQSSVELYNMLDYNDLIRFVVGEWKRYAGIEKVGD